MQDRIKQIAEEAGIFEEVRDRNDKVMGGVFYASADDLQRFAQAVARECAEICLAEDRLGLDDERAYNGRLMAEAIRARYGIKE